MAIIRDQSPSVNRRDIDALRRSHDEARAILRALFIADFEGTPRAVERVAVRERRVRQALSLDMAKGLLATVRDNLPLDEANPPDWLGHALNIMRREQDEAKRAAWLAADRKLKIFGLTMIASVVLSVEVTELDAQEARLALPHEPANSLLAQASPVQTFRFYSDDLEVIVPANEEPTRDNVRIVIRRMCEALGVDFSRQLRKLKQAPWSCVVEMTTQVGGQSRSVSTIPLSALPMWLARLNPGKVRPGQRARILAYQCEAADALADRFIGKPDAKPQYPQPQTQAAVPALPATPPAPTNDWRVLRERRLSAKVLAEMARDAIDQAEARHLRVEARRLLTA